MKARLITISVRLFLSVADDATGTPTNEASALDEYPGFDVSKLVTYI